MRRLAFFLLLVTTGILGFVAGALSVQDPPASVSYDFASPAPSSTSLAYGLGYEVSIQYANQTITVANVTPATGAGPSVGAVSASYSLGIGLAADSYQAGTVAPGDPATIIVPPPATVTQTITETQTVTQTVTETVTQVEERQVTVPAPAQVEIPEDEPVIDPKLLGLGAAAALLILLAAKR